MSECKGLVVQLPLMSGVDNYAVDAQNCCRYRATKQPEVVFSPKRAEQLAQPRCVQELHAPDVNLLPANLLSPMTIFAACRPAYTQEPAMG
jgi:hypothetical protein